MSAHAFLAPSSAARWGVCALSASLEAAYPETEASPESLEGTAAHWTVEMTLRGVPPAVDTQAPNGVAVTLEMLQAAELVVECIENTLGPSWRSMLVIERRVQVQRIHPTHCWGTPDYYAWYRAPDGRLFLFLFDFKFGHGVVEVAENLQLVTYAAGLMSEVPDLDDQNTVVAMCILQPRSHHRDGPARWWKVRGSDLRGQVNILHMQAEKALSPNPPAVPDPDACENCRGRHACEANQRAAYRAAAKGQQSQAVDLPPAAVGLELRALTRAAGLLQARITGLQAQAESLIKRGQPVPFWAMTSTPGRLTWNIAPAQAIAMGQIYGVDIAADPVPVTPTQAKAKGLPASIVDAVASRPNSALKLTFDDGSKARLVFGYGNT